MAGTKAHRLAKALLAKENLSLTEEITTAHLDKAMASKDRPRVRELSEILALIDEVKNAPTDEDEE